MKKLDLRKELKHLYNPSAREPALVDVPPMTFACIDGRGDPNGPDFAAATGALYAFSYTIKFLVKKERAIDYPVMALEGLWSIEGKADFAMGDYQKRDAWRWTLMIMQPEAAGPDLWPVALEQAARRGTPFLERLRFEPFHEGQCAADHAHRAVLDGAGNRRSSAQFHSRTGPAAARQAPRDLLGRPAPFRPRQAEDGPPPSR